jgi:hypothetical protein
MLARDPKRFIIRLKAIAGEENVATVMRELPGSDESEVKKNG